MERGGSGGERPGGIEARGSAQTGPPFVRGACDLPMHWCPCLSLCPRPALLRLRPISPILKTAGGRSPLPDPPPLPATCRSTKRNGRHALTNLNFASRAAFFAAVALGLFRRVAFEAPRPFSMVLPPKPIMPTESVGRLQSVTLYTREDRHFQSKPCGTFSLGQYIPHASKPCADTLRPRRCAARSRVPPSNVENAARVGASLHDGPRSRCHSAVRLVWRARSAGLGQRHCPGVAAVEGPCLV